MRLISLELSNFQVHKHLLVEFGKGITTLTGQTDSGKSAILRALRWVCQNDIPGDDFIREGAKQTTVTLTVLEGKQKHTVIRTRGSGNNTYELNGNEYKSFNNSVPADITKLLNLNEINFQNQHDAPYWFSETAGEVSRRLNAIIDLSVIDTALSNVATEVRKAQERQTISEERLTEIKKEYEELEPQKDRIAEFTALRQSHEKFLGLETDAGRLCSVIEKIRSHRDKVTGTRERAEEGDGVLSLAREVVRFERRTESLSGIVEDIRLNREAAQPPPDFTSVNTAWERLGLIKTNSMMLAGKINGIEKLEVTIKHNLGWLAECQSKFVKLTRNQQCPTCGKQL